MYKQFGLLIASILCLAFLRTPVAAAADVRNIIFPVLGGATFRNDFGDPRSGGRTHEGNDVFAPKHTPLLSAVDGQVRHVVWPQASYGYFVSIEDDDGYEYWYLHINNDRPGTDDGQGGGRYAYYPNVERGQRVVRGQIIALAGDSGNAESAPPHLHFEIHRPDGNVINPFLSLQAAQRLTKPVLTPKLDDEFLPFAEFRGGANIVSGDIWPESLGDEIIAGAGPGGGPLVKILDQYGNPLKGFYAYDQIFHGGVEVALGDINGDGQKEIITAPSRGDQPYVRVFTAQGGLLAEFLAFKRTFLGGVQLAAIDTDGDGIDEIVTGAGPGGRPDVRIYRATGELLRQFYTHTTLFLGGVDVAALPAAGDQPGYIIVSPLRGGGPDVRIFGTDTKLVGSFLAYDGKFRGGIRVSTRQSQDGLNREILTVPASGGGGHLRRFSATGTFQDEASFFEEWWTGGFDVAGNADRIYVVSGPGGRRASVRYIDALVTPPATDENDEDFDPFDGFGD